MPVTEITRAETRERARLLLVRSYDADLVFTVGPDTFASVSPRQQADWLITRIATRQPAAEARSLRARTLPKVRDR